VRSEEEIRRELDKLVEISKRADEVGEERISTISKAIIGWLCWVLDE